MKQHSTEKLIEKLNDILGSVEYRDIQTAYWVNFIRLNVENSPDGYKGSSKDKTNYEYAVKKSISKNDYHSRVGMKLISRYVTIRENYNKYRDDNIFPLRKELVLRYIKVGMIVYSSLKDLENEKLVVVSFDKNKAMVRRTKKSIKVSNVYLHTLNFKRYKSMRTRYH